VASICSFDCSWLLRRSRACFQSQNPFFNKEMCTFCRIRAHQSTSETMFVKEKNKASFYQLLRRCGSGDEQDLWCISIDEFLSFLCCGASWHNFSSHCQREPVSFFNQYFCIYSGILSDQRPISLPTVIVSAISSIVFFDDTSWPSHLSFFCYCTAG